MKMQKIRYISLIILFQSFIFITLQSCAMDYEEELVGGYRLLSEGPNQTTITKYGGSFIPCNIIAFDYNIKFIIAASIQQKSCFWGSKNELYTIKEGTLNFWIIDIPKDKILGPFNYYNFIKKKELLGVNKSLELELNL